MSLIVDLNEFSELCGVTAETMRGYVRAVEGSPAWLIERGERGRGYKIEPVGGRAWWDEKRANDDQASAERQAALQQLRLDYLGDTAETPEALSLSGKQRREEYDAALVRIKLRRTMGELIEVAEIEAPGTLAVVELRRQLMLVPGEFAALSGMAPDDVKPLAGLIERAVNAFLAALPSPIKGAPDA